MNSYELVLPGQNVGASGHLQPCPRGTDSTTSGSPELQLRLTSFAWTVRGAMDRLTELYASLPHLLLCALFKVDRVLQEPMVRCGQRHVAMPVPAREFSDSTLGPTLSVPSHFSSGVSVLSPTDEPVVLPWQGPAKAVALTGLDLTCTSPCLRYPVDKPKQLCVRLHRPPLSIVTTSCLA